MRVALGVALLMSTSITTADENLPRQGNVFLSGDVRLALRDGSFDSGFSANLQPMTIGVMASLDWMPWRRPTVGAQLTWAHVTGIDTDCPACTRDRWDKGVGGRLGYMIELSGHLAFWPRIGMSYVRRDTDAGPAYGRATFDASNPLIFADGGTFFGVGPTVEADVLGPSMHPRELVLGGAATVGGTF